MAKVISLEEARKQREELQNTEIPTPDPFIEQRLNEEAKKAEDLSNYFADCMREYAEWKFANTEGQHESMLVPIEALTLGIINTLKRLDEVAMPDPEDQEDHMYIRQEANLILLTAIKDIFSQYMQAGYRIYQHDMIITLAATILSLVFEQRYTQIVAEKKGEIAYGEGNSAGSAGADGQGEQQGEERADVPSGATE